jgi:hypothetical protein
VEVKRILQNASAKGLDRCLSSSSVKEQPLLLSSFAKTKPSLPFSPVNEQPLPTFSFAETQPSLPSSHVRKAAFTVPVGCLVGCMEWLNGVEAN